MLLSTGNRTKNTNRNNSIYLGKLLFELENFCKIFIGCFHFSILLSYKNSKKWEENKRILLKTYYPPMAFRVSTKKNTAIPMMIIPSIP